MNPLYEPQCFSLGAFVTLTNVGANYDSINAARGLGMVQMDFTNVQHITFGVDVNKVGSGTQSWQLWNVTNSTEIAVINDSGGAGNKSLTTTVDFPGLSGMKVVRVRAKSTNAADDPLYYGAYVCLT
jgi:hypothetical protein